MKNEGLREASHENPDTVTRELRVLCKNLVVPSMADIELEESINDLANTVKFSGKIEFHFSITGAPGNGCVLNVFFPI
jgi:hypothetical protein